MGLGFLFKVDGDKAHVLGSDGMMMEIPTTSIPKGAKPGTSVDIGDGMSPHPSHSPDAPPAPTNSAPADQGDRQHTGRVEARQQYAMHKIISMGWTPEQAAGVVGRFMQEAYPDLRTGAVGDKGISFGIGQWNKERRTALVNFAKEHDQSPLSLDTQLEFWNHEIRTDPSQALALKTLQEAKNPYQASIATMHYERPQGYTPNNPAAGHGFQNTVRNANGVMKVYDPEYKVDLASIGGASGEEGDTGAMAGLDNGGADQLLQTTAEPRGPSDSTTDSGKTFTPPDLSGLTNMDTTLEDQLRQNGAQRISNLLAQGMQQYSLPQDRFFGDIFNQS